jgi:transposase
MVILWGGAMSKQKPPWTGQPQEIPDAEHEQLVARVCAIDVGKQAGKVCTRVPHPEHQHRRVCKIWDVAATTNAVGQLAEQLLDLGVQKVTVESTADYWRIWFYLLEAVGLQVQLVNARDVKNVPGRPKTDKLDAVWLAKLTEKGMLRPSFVPPAPVRVLRDYTRLRVDLTRERSRFWQRLEKLLEDSLIKISSVASSLDLISTRDMLEALIRGERDPHTLAGLARGRMRTNHTELLEALTGAFDDHHGELARIMLDQIDGLTRQIDQLTTRIDELIAAIPAAAIPDPDDDDTGDPATRALPAVQRLAETPGIGQSGAQAILAEVGLDMTRFPTP